MQTHFYDLSNCFIQDGYTLIPNAVKDTQLACLEKAFIAQVESGMLLPSPTKYLDRTDYYNCTVFNELLLGQLPLLEQVTQEPLWPTYLYARYYRRGSSLKPHVDRAACEITATITISTTLTRPWPICLQARSGGDVSVAAKPGDMIVFQGAELKHWREQFEGEQQLQLFLHYVRKRGEFSALRFDARL